MVRSYLCGAGGGVGLDSYRVLLDRKRPLRVLLLTKSLTRGGSASGAGNLVTALQSAGAHLICLDAYATQAYTVVGVLRVLERIYERIALGAETHCLRLGPPVFDLVRLYTKHRPDIIQLCDISGNVIRLSDVARVPCPVVHRMSDFWPYHGARHYADMPPKRMDVAEWLLRQTITDGRYVPDMLVAPSEWLAARLQQQPRLSGRIRFIRNAATAPEHVPVRTHMSDALHLGFIANKLTDDRKGLTTLPPRLAALAKRGQKIVLNLFGHGQVTGFPQVPGVAVRANGPFERRSLRQIYEQFDVLLCPSVRDNSPNAVTEALAHGIPVIAQAGTGMDSYVSEQTGALINYHDDDEAALDVFVAAVERIVGRYASISAAASEYARRFLHPRVIGQSYLELYAELIARGKCV